MCRFVMVLRYFGREFRLVEVIERFVSFVDVVIFLGMVYFVVLFKFKFLLMYKLMMFVNFWKKFFGMLVKLFWCKNMFCKLVMFVRDGIVFVKLLLLSFRYVKFVIWLRVDVIVFLRFVLCSCSCIMLLLE